jgi:fatty-acyl-CoA synthase
VKGADTPPLSELTVPALLANTAALHGSRPAVVFREQNIRWTWNEFSAEVDRMAAGLHALGLRKGDRVGIWSPTASSGC